MSAVQNVFFDLDDTLWDFSTNSKEAFEETYLHYKFDTYFDSFSHYYALYETRNVQLWDEYAEGKITKVQLNEQRFLYPLAAVGHDNAELARQFSETFFCSGAHKVEANALYKGNSRVSVAKRLQSLHHIQWLRGVTSAQNALRRH